STLIDSKILQQSILPLLQKEAYQSIEEIKKIIPIEDVKISTEINVRDSELLKGSVIVTLEGKSNSFLIIPCKQEIMRSLSVPEVEFSVIGPKESFSESLNQNINLVRKRLPIKELVVEEFIVGKLSKTRVAVLHIE